MKIYACTPDPVIIFLNADLLRGLATVFVVDERKNKFFVVIIVNIVNNKWMSDGVFADFYFKRRYKEKEESLLLLNAV